MKSRQSMQSITHMQRLNNSNVFNLGPGDDDDDALPEDIEEEWVPQDAW